MYLVYLTSHLDVSSVKQWLYIKDKSDALIIDDVDDLVNEVLLDSYDIIVFDYKMDITLIDTLRTLDGKYSSIQVFVANTRIGEAYLSVTENISVLPKSLNLMVYLWQHPAFSLGNMLNAEEASKEVFSVDTFADIDTENEVLEFKTTIEDLGESDLAEIEMLKVEKQSIISESVEEAEEETEDFDELTGLTTQSLSGVIKRNKVAVAVEEALEEVVVAAEETTVEEVVEETPVEEIAEPLTSATIEETSEFTETIEEVVEPVEETTEFTETIEEVVEPVEETTEFSEPVEETTEPQLVDGTLETVIPSMNEATNFVENILREGKPVEEVQTVYEKYDENRKDVYDGVIINEKAITEETVVEAEYDNDMKSIFGNAEDMGVVGKSDVGDTATEYHIKPEDQQLYESRQAQIIQDLKESREKIELPETPSKQETKVLKGSQSYVPPTQTTIKRVGIKTVETPKDNMTSVKRGTLAGLRKRSMKTYRNSYEYFKEKGFALDKLEEVYNYVQTENLKGSSLLLEEELYARGLIDDDTFIVFMKEYLHRQVLTLTELMQSDVILGTWDEVTCRQLRLLELPSSQGDGKCVVISHKAKAIQNSLLSKYEKLELYVTLDRYIDIRLGDKED